MADWFSDLVTQVSADVIGTQETEDKLALTDRVTAQTLTRRTAGAVDELRRQFAADIRVIQGLDDEIQQAEHALLQPEWNAVISARSQVEQARSVRSSPAPTKADRVRKFLHLGNAATQPGSSYSTALADLSRAQQAFADAMQDKGIADVDAVQRPAIRRDNAVIGLTGNLHQALAVRVNAAIDHELEASYERVFSYSGTAELGDPLALAAQPVDTDAFRRLKYLIEDVGSGTIGVAGPRGSGKSTLLHQFATTIADSSTRRWGLYVPAPAKYDARDFLLYLFARLCAEVLGPARTRQVEERLSTASPAAAAARSLVLPVADLAVLAAMALTCWGLVTGLTAARLSESPARMTDLLIACCCAIVSLISVAALLVAVRKLVITAPGGVAAAQVSGGRVLSGPAQAALPWSAGLGALAAIVLFGLLPLGVSPAPAYVAAAGLGAAGLTAVVLLRYPQPKQIRLAAQGPTGPRWFPEPLYDNAAQWYAKAKFQQTFTTGWSGTITVGAAPLPQLQGGLSGSSDVSALAMPIPEIVERIKEFITTIAVNDQPEASPERARPVPVVIGIDEIDKIDDPADAESFFNQIKGLFGDTSAVFLISISDDAMAAFERRGLPFRDTFDSSLSSVVTLSYLSRAQARKLIGGPLVGVQEPVADLLYVLSGGLARDLVRLIRRAVEARQADQGSLDALMLNLISGETEAKRKAVLATARSIALCPARGKLLEWAGTQAAPADPASYYAGLLESTSSLLATGCQGGHDADPDSCPAREIGTLLGWLGTTGQVFTKAASRDDFLAGESAAAGSAAAGKSFDRLAHTRQDFPLGASYVLPIITAYRTAWALPVVPGLP